MTTTELTLKRYIDKSVDFETYINRFQEDVINYKANKKIDSLYPEYLPINLQRLKRGIKQASLSPALLSQIQQLRAPVYWLVLTEPWCGDAAQSLGFLNAVSEASNGKIKLGLLYRDQNLELMDQFLTNGGRSVPKLIQFDDQQNITGFWGPRPEVAQELVLQLKSAGEPYANALHGWYAKDKNLSIDLEIQQLLP